jgi:RimJ/RimL family protein N-acetyltransferase
MVEKATATGSVHTVVAHTLADENPSTRVLRRVGFQFVGEVPDEEQGTVWRWELNVD